MRFERSSEQQDMAAAVRDLLGSVDVPAIARGWDADPGPWHAVWRSLTEMGVTGVGVPEKWGGLELGPVELVACMEELGYAGLPGPLVESLAVLPALVRDSPVAESWLSRLAAGELLATVTVAEHVPFALDADRADLVLALTTTGAQHLAGPVVRQQSSFDPARRLFTVDSDARSEVEGATNDTAVQHGVLATAAMLIGAGHRMLDLCTRYVTERQQFGRPIGEFQAVKHHLANVLIALEFARPLVHGACLSLAGRSEFAARDVSAAKIAAGDAADTAARVALQVHGAIGYTVEHDLHLWFTRTRALRSSWGTPDWHRQQVADALRRHGTAVGLGSPG